MLYITSFELIFGSKLFLFLLDNMLFDEFDKMFYSRNDYRDAYSPMQDFLKILEGGTYTFRCGNRSETVNLDKTPFLFAGACAKIVKALQIKYARPATAGFLSQNADIPQVDVSDYGSLVTLEDLCAYGMMPEMCSRINTVIHISKLDADAKRISLSKELSSEECINRFCDEKFFYKNFAVSETML